MITVPSITVPSGLRVKARLTCVALATVAAVSGAIVQAASAAAPALPEIRLSRQNAVPRCVTPDRLMAFLKQRNGQLSPRFRDIARFYKQHGEAWGVRMAEGPLQGVTARAVVVLDEFDKAAVGYMIVLTKCDEVKAADMPKRLEETKAAIAKRPAAFPEVFATSSLKGTGVADVRAAVVRLMNERGYSPS